MKPEDILPDDVNSVDLDGVPVRKGSIGAFLANARVLSSPAFPKPEKERAKKDLLALVPALRKLGLFEVFEIRDPEIRRLVESVPIAQ